MKFKSLIRGRFSGSLSSLRPIILLALPLVNLSQDPHLRFAHIHLSQDGSQSEGFWEKQNLLQPGISSDFRLQGDFLSMCNASFILYSGRVLASLCPCHDYSLEMFTRDKDRLFTLFLWSLPFWRGNRRPAVNSVQPHRRQPTRLLHPWDSPGKNNGVGCHCLLRKRRLGDCKYPTWSLSISCLRIRGSGTWERDWGSAHPGVASLCFPAISDQRALDKPRSGHKT